MATKMSLSPNGETFEHGVFPLHAPAAVAPARLLGLGRVLGPHVEAAPFIAAAHAELGLEPAHGALLFDHFGALRGLPAGAALPSRELLLFLFAQGFQNTVVRSPVKSHEETVGDTWPRHESLARAAAQPSARALAVLARGGRRLGEQARERLGWLSRHADFLIDVLAACGARAERGGGGCGGGPSEPVAAAAAAAAAGFCAADVDVLGVLLEVTVFTLATAEVRAPAQATPLSALFSIRAAAAEPAAAALAPSAASAAAAGARLSAAELRAEMLALLAEGAAALPKPARAGALAGSSPGSSQPTSPLARATAGGGGGGQSLFGAAGALAALPFPSLGGGAGPQGSAHGHASGALSITTDDDEMPAAAAAILRPGVMLSHACVSGAAAAATAAAAAAAAVASPADAAAGVAAGAGGALISGSRLHISGLHRRTQLVERHALGESPASQCEVVISDCHHCFLYLLAPVR
jgi:hypothetical protein